MFEDSANEPDYSPGSGLGPDADYSGGGFGMPQNMGKIIKLGVVVIILVIVAVAFFGWWGSQKNVSFRLADSQNNDITGRLTIKDSTGRAVGLSPSGTSTAFSATLWPGKYTYTATASGYKMESEAFEVASDTSAIKVTMLRDLTATLTIVLGEQQIYYGQALTGKLQVTNTGKSFNVSDIVLSKSDLLQASIIPNGTTTIGQGESVVLDFNLTVKTKPATNKDTNFTFEISGSSIKSEKETISVLPSVSDTKVGVSGLSANMSLNAGETKAMPLTIRNSDKFPIENLIVQIIPADASSEDNIGWFSFDANANGAAQTSVGEIDPSASANLTLYATPPKTARKGDKFSGQLVLSSYSMSQQKSTAMQFTVNMERTASVQYSGQDSFPSTCKTSTMDCTPITVTNQIRLQNTGNTDVGKIAVDIDYTKSAADTSYCLSWLILDTNSIDGLAPSGRTGSSDFVRMRITPIYEPTSRAIVCYLRWEYTDPITENTLDTNSHPITITTTVS